MLLLLLHVSLAPGICISDSELQSLLLILSAASSCKLTLAVRCGKAKQANRGYSVDKFAVPAELACSLTVRLSVTGASRPGQPPPRNVAKDHQIGI